MSTGERIGRDAGTKDPGQTAEVLRAVLGPLLETMADRVKFGEPLADYTHFRVGGPADALVEVTSIEELSSVMQALRKSKTPWWILGSGSNVLVLDKGIRGVVLRLEGVFLKVERQDRRVTAGGAVLMPGLAHTTARWGLSGLECLVGIPGTVGGGVHMNAGVPEGEIKDHVATVRGITSEGEERRWTREELEFAYRQSVLQRSPAVVTSVDFELEESTPEACETKLRGFLRKRTYQPLGEPNMGSMFRNPPGGFAGQLIEQAGLKGMTQGNVQVSPKHANFFINRGGATAEDALALMEIVRRKVREATGVVLEPEVQVVGEK